jgi:hypothetical protein
LSFETFQDNGLSMPLREPYLHILSLKSEQGRLSFPAGPQDPLPSSRLVPDGQIPIKQPPPLCSCHATRPHRAGTEQDIDAFVRAARGAAAAVKIMFCPKKTGRMIARLCLESKTLHSAVENILPLNPKPRAYQPFNDFIRVADWVLDVYADEAEKYQDALRAGNGNEIEKGTIVLTDHAVLLEFILLFLKFWLNLVELSGLRL